MNKFQLYDLQKDFIKKASGIIKNNGLGIFSSPTGTGKTLSLLLSIQDMLTEDVEDDMFLREILGATNTSTKIYYTSRTHQQLNQCIQELKKVNKLCKSVILGSKRIYCINEEVKKTSLEHIKQQCSDLRSKNMCKYYENKVNKEGIFDIEDAVSLAKKESFCPYYFTRDFSKKCEIVFLPYNVIFTYEGRKSLKINLEDSVLIVDEAHNIIETVIQLNSSQIYFKDIKSHIEAFKKYSKRFETPHELLESFIAVIKNLFEYAPTIVNNDQDFCVKNVTDFTMHCKISNFNMFEIEEFITQKRINYKIEGYAKNLNFKINDIFKFIKLLTDSDDGVRVEVTKQYLKIFPIDPQIYFDNILKCKSAILAGGTMEPVDSLLNIFRNRNPEYHTFNSLCKSFCPVILDDKIKYTEQTRDYDEYNNKIFCLINQLYKCLDKEGMIVFFPSKAALLTFKRYMELKKLFLECFFEYESILEDYIQKLKTKACILMAVIGGNFSEGINFKDDLCRILLIVGVPYPSLNAEIKERIKCLGKEYYTEMAMKKVNQALGRCIRHKNDFAVMILLDERYKTLKKYISPWISSKIAISKISNAVSDTNEFLKSHRSGNE